MKICFPSTGPDLQSKIDSRFGRCPYFLIIDSDRGELIKSIPNTGVQASRGAGVTAGQIIVDEAVDAVVAGNIGPNAMMVLNQAGIKVYSGVFDLTIQQAIDKFKKGELSPSSTANASFGPGRQGRGQE